MPTLDDLISGVDTLRNTMTGALFIEDRGPSDYSWCARNTQPPGSGSAQNQVEGVSAAPQTIAMRLNGDLIASTISALGAADAFGDADEFLVQSGGLLKKMLGSTMAAAIATAVWNKLTSEILTGGSIGVLIKAALDATISSRSSHSAATVRDAILDEVIDVETLRKLIKVGFAILANIAAPGVGTVEFKGRDGVTTVAIITYGDDPGERVASVIS